MRATISTADAFLPVSRDLKSLREAARECQGCPLFENATHTVFGAGPARAEVMMVGEQPGDVEDRQGEPFVGPAGLLDQLMAEVGIVCSWGEQEQVVSLEFMSLCSGTLH